MKAIKPKAVLKFFFFCFFVFKHYYINLSTKNNTNIKNTGTKGGTVVKAKVVVSSNGQNPTVEGIYNDESNLGEVSKEFNEEEEKERFEEPGDIIDKRNIVLKK